ncbi:MULTISPECIES: hypothetical protein [unclassified Companilactobacillus]|uniref:hypothetical protein n=1 Tax=unclassified Companilactobacillus TaxID=2767904 RepID=UPI002FEE66DC
MSEAAKKKKMNIIIWILCALIALGAFGIPRIYHNYHSAPNYYSVGQKIPLENSKTHKLNDFQKHQFIKIAKNTIDKKDGPYNWHNYKTISIAVYKMNDPHEYGLIYKMKSKSSNEVLTNSMIVKLKSSDLLQYHKISIKRYVSEMSASFR